MSRDEIPAFPDPGEDGWPEVDGRPLSIEEFTDALVGLVESGLIEMRIDDDGELWIRATDTGLAAYEIENVFKDLGLDSQYIDWNDPLPPSV